MEFTAVFTLNNITDCALKKCPKSTVLEDKQYKSTGWTFRKPKASKNNYVRAINKIVFLL
ncbi:MAG TPA: hypothetical protein DIT65_05390 [Cryomorphaceae bacterium]|nr:hypothetical protein [Cryomorphaceae bacterium]